MKRLIISLFSLITLVLSLNTVNAWHVSGQVFCDQNLNGEIDPGDSNLANIVVMVENLSGTFRATGVTDENGFYSIRLLDTADWYVATLDLSDWPGDTTIVGSSEIVFPITDGPPGWIYENANWLIQSSRCRGKCWLTTGGVKFEPVVGKRLATGNIKGPKGNATDSMGGNVNPGCSPTAGDGGQWNHVSHLLNLHFQGFAIQVLDCGNVEPPPPEGSDSPETPFNYIVFQGTGRLQGIGGNKMEPQEVSFFARCEDRNEPGAKEANDGAFIDRYFLQVFTDPSDPVGSKVLLFDVDGIPNADPFSVDPKTITGGNIQIHISSCDKPPQL